MPTGPRGEKRPVDVMAQTTRNRLVGFRSRKAAQAAAYFACKSRSKSDKMKLIKLLYLIERESIKQRGRPMLFDEFYSMKDGPICSDALNGINGELDKPIWNKYLIKVDNKTIKPTKTFSDSDLDEISKSDLEILAHVWTQFGHMTSPKSENGRMIIAKSTKA
jgi:uncharacterized phage-associated protein